MVEWIVCGVYALAVFVLWVVGNNPRKLPKVDALTALKSHKWTGCQSDPFNHPGEYVRYCSVCGIEDTCEDSLPPCPGAPEVSL